MYGGGTEFKKDVGARHFFDDMFVFNTCKWMIYLIDSEKWHHVNYDAAQEAVKVPPPLPRMYHASAIYGCMFVTFGGQTESKISSDFGVYDLRKFFYYK